VIESFLPASTAEAEPTPVTVLRIVPSTGTGASLTLNLSSRCAAAEIARENSAAGTITTKIDRLNAMVHLNYRNAGVEFVGAL
jgi:hypothetical protein